MDKSNATLSVAERELVETDIVQMFHAAIKEVIPGAAPSSGNKIYAPQIKGCTKVIIEIIGQIKGKMVISGKTSVFQKVSEMMFGMTLDGEMLDSFIGELGNMIGGNLSIQLSKIDVAIDITSPILFKENMMFAEDTAVLIDTCFSDNERLSLYFLQD